MCESGGKPLHLGQRSKVVFINETFPPKRLCLCRYLSVRPLVCLFVCQQAGLPSTKSYQVMTKAKGLLSLRLQHTLYLSRAAILRNDHFLFFYPFSCFDHFCLKLSKHLKVTKTGHATSRSTGDSRSQTHVLPLPIIIYPRRKDISPTYMTSSSASQNKTTDLFVPSRTWLALSDSITAMHTNCLKKYVRQPETLDQVMYYCLALLDSHSVSIYLSMYVCPQIFAAANRLA